MESTCQTVLPLTVSTRQSRTPAGRRLHLAAVCLMLLVIGLPVQAAASERPTVRQVRVAGARRVSESLVRGWLTTRPGMPLDSLALRQDLRRILEGYRDEGFWQVAVLWPQVDQAQDGVEVLIEVQEGRRTRIRSVLVDGEQPTDLNSVRLHSRFGEPLTPAGLAADCRALVSFMGTRGHPFAVASPHAALVPGERDADVTFEVDAGPRVLIERVLFTGNRITREGVLVREVRHLVGAVFDQREVDTALGRLRQLSFLEGAGEPEIRRLQAGGFSLVFTVEETPAARAYGVIGYAPDPGDSGGGLTGSFSLDLANVAGTGRAGSVTWDRSGPETSGLGVAYREPWVLGRPVAIGASASMRHYPGFRQDRSALTVGLNLGGTAGVEIGLEHLRVQATDTGPKRLPSGTETGARAAFRLDRRDDRWNPRRGFLLRSATSLSRVDRAITTGGRATGALDLDLFRPLTTRSVLGVGLHAAGVAEGGNLSAVSRLRLGGAESIRGYAEERFLSRTAVWVNLEWRVPMGRRSRVYLFTDTGRLQVADGFGGDRFVYPVGYGAGLLAESQMGLVGLGYGLSRGERPGQGRLHLRLASSF
jgi:outer membrane protein assembly factor BamA